MRLLSVGLVHETNTFAATPNRLADFAQASGGDPAFPAPDIVRRFGGTATIHGGYVAKAESLGIRLEPLFHAQATPGGVVEQAAYEGMKGELLSRLAAGLPADGVLLDLHGAQSSWLTAPTIPAAAPLATTPSS
jgi:microcystin degradation protein MlrC